MTTKRALMGSGAVAPSIFHARPGLPTMLRGAMIPRAPEDDNGSGSGEGGGGEGDNGPPAVDPAKYQALVAAHERLKKDSAADRTQLADLKARLDAFDAKEVAAAEEAAKASGDFETIKAQLETRHKKELDARDVVIASQRGQIEALVIDNGLASQLDAVRVRPEFKAAVTAMLRQGIEIKDEDGRPVAYLNHAPLKDAVQLWAESDEGKAFIGVDNSGGGAGGGAKPAGGGEPNPWKAETINRTKQAEILRADPEKARRLKSEAGVA